MMPPDSPLLDRTAAAAGGCASPFSTPRWRGSNSGPRGFIARGRPQSESTSSQGEKVDAAVYSRPASVVVPDYSPSSHQHDASKDGKQLLNPPELIRPSSLLSKADEAGVFSMREGEETPIRSPAMSSNENTPRKKQRLAWGQGLAKFEKKKVGGSPDAAGDSRSVQRGSSPKAATTEDMGSHVTSNVECILPIAPCPVVSCASPARLEDNPCIKEANVNDVRPSDSSRCGLQDCLEFSIKFDPLEISAIDNLTLVLAALLQREDPPSDDSSFTSLTTTTKLLELKGSISKELEKTECEIDLLENELKTLNTDIKNDPCHSSLQPVLPRVPRLHSVDRTLKIPLGFTEDAKDNNMVSVPLKSDNSTSTLKSSSDSGARILTVCTIDNGGSVMTVSGHENGTCLNAGSTDLYADNEISRKSNIDGEPIASIMSSNQEIAKRSSQVFDKALTADPFQHANWRSDYMLSCRRNIDRVREKLAVRKRLCKLTDRVLGLKFTAFKHLWKEDLRLLSIQKSKAKSHKQFDVNSLSTKSTSQRHRSSVRSRFMLPAGNLTLVPTSEIVDFTSKLLSNPLTRLQRRSMNMPALILDEMEKKYSRFISHNGLVEDPTSFEKEREMINPWTQEEKEVFMEMLGTFGKDFTKISSHLSHRTTADCIEFYYKNHKSEIFKDMKKRRKVPECIPSKKYLVTSRKNWNRDETAASPDMLEAAPAAAKLLKVNRGSSYLERASCAEISRHEIETETADVLAGICDDLSSEAMSSCVTSSLNPAEKTIYATVDRSLTPQAILNFDDEDTCSDEGCGELDSVDWTDEEKSLLIRALGIYGMDFSGISHFVGTRSREQCKIFFSKARKSLGLNTIHLVRGIRAAPMTDMDGGQSDTDDACTREMGSETDGLSEQYEMGGTDHPEVQGKVDRFEPLPDHEKLAKERENSQSYELMEADCLIWNEGKQFHEISECVNGKPGDSASSEKKRGDSLNCPESLPVKSVIAGSLEAGQMKSCAGALVQEDTRGRYSVGNLKAKVESCPSMVPASGTSRQKIEAVKNAENDVSVSFAPDSDELRKNFSASHVASVPSYLQPLPGQLLSYPQNPRIHFNQDNSINLAPNKLLPGSSVSFKDLDYGNNLNQKLVARDSYQPCLSTNLSPNQITQPLHIFRGYPLQEDKNRDADNISETNITGSSQPTQFILPDMNSEENSRSQLLRPCSQTSSRETSSQSQRTGNVKLFGQILSQSSSQQKPNSPPEDCDSRSVSPRWSKSSTMKPSDSRKDKETSSGLGSNDHTGQAELPLKSYGFWDGTRIQTGYSSLPESAVMLAKCQGHVPSSNGVLTDYQQAYLQNLAASGKWPNSSSGQGVLTDYQQAYLQSLVASGKWPNSFLELPVRNEFDAGSVFQQQARARGANMAAGGAILDGARGGISDPVAALRLHYARRPKIGKNVMEG